MFVVKKINLSFPLLFLLFTVAYISLLSVLVCVSQLAVSHILIKLKSILFVFFLLRSSMMATMQLIINLAQGLPRATQETPLCYSHIQYGSDSCHTVYTQEMNGSMLDTFFFLRDVYFRILSD